MKVLWLLSESNKDRFYGFSEHLKQQCDLTERWLDSKQSKHVVKAVGAKEIKQYDRVLLQLPVSIIVKQAAYLRCVPNLVLLQPALTSVVMSNSKDYEKYLKLLAQAPWIRVLVPYGQLKNELANLNVDVAEVPIGMNTAWFKSKDLERAHWAAIVADLESPDVKSRRHLLFDVKTQNKLQIFELESSDLPAQLNTIGILITSDEGWKNYRPLNFQAMACGALLMTWDRGEEENKACGFVDMENVLLFSNAKTAQAKLNFMKRHPDQLSKIRENGQQLAKAQHSNRTLAEQVYYHLSTPLVTFTGDDAEDAIKFRFFR